MQIVDANIILRYLLSDNEELSALAEQIIDNNSIYLPIEVLCEVVYVLEKVYNVDKSEITTELTGFLNDIDVTVPSKETVLVGLRNYGTENLDFVDCILAGYSEVNRATIHSFDKKLNNLITKNNAD